MSKARSYYESANLSHIPELMKLAPEAAASYFSFERQVYQQSHQLPVKTKELKARLLLLTNYITHLENKTNESSFIMSWNSFVFFIYSSTLFMIK